MLAIINKRRNGSAFGWTFQEVAELAGLTDIYLQVGLAVEDLLELHRVTLLVHQEEALDALLTGVCT